MANVANESDMIMKMRTVCCIGFLFLVFARATFAWTQNGTNFMTNGSQADVQAAVYAATNNCVIKVPAGKFIWGTNRSSIYVTTNLTLTGAGTNQTIIYLTNGPTFGNGTIAIVGPATVCNMSIYATNSNATAISCGAGDGWHVYNIYYDGRGGSDYFLYSSSYGLINHCTMIAYGGTDELIFMRGYDDSWQTPDSMGTTNAVYIEDCIFYGGGYVCDANANSRAVVRFCTINGRMKIDGHGKASNTPPRGVRHMEIYDNVWTYGDLPDPFNAQSIELRGGSGMIFGNTYTGTGVYARMILDEYGVFAQWPNFLNVYQTPINYPIDDQIGVGQDPKVAHSDPVYYWMNTANPNNNDGITVTSGLQTNDWNLVWMAPDAGAIALWTNQIKNASATFSMTNIIQEDRDFFSDIYITNYNGTTGMGWGSKSQMLAITPTINNTGFWVTNEGNWNLTAPTNSSGQLYVWNGSTWVLKYVPLIYPFETTSNLSLSSFNWPSPSPLQVVTPP